MGLLARFGILTLLVAACGAPASAQGAGRDAIRDLIARSEPRPPATKVQSKGPARPKAPVQAQPDTDADKAAPPPERDPREGDPTFEQAQRLMRAIDAILDDAARKRSDLRKLKSRDDYVIPPIFTETREDRDRKIRDLMDAAIGIVTDVPIVDIQKRIETHRANIRDLEDRILRLREKQLVAPKSGMLPGIVTDTYDSLDKDIASSKKSIEANREAIAKSKEEVREALEKSGITMSEAQVELLLDGVLAGDLTRLMAVFNAAKLIDAQLGKLLAASGENLAGARKYFAMHAALFALLVHTQDQTIGRIDRVFLPRLDAIMKDIAAARQRTNELLRAENRPDQRRALESNRESQRLAEEAARSYRRYLLQQREQIARARSRTVHDLKIADNTYETVEASFQLRNLMRDALTTFDSLQRLEAPTFDQIFRNEELRREFENLTRRLNAPSS